MVVIWSANLLGQGGSLLDVFPLVNDSASAVVISEGCAAWNHLPKPLSVNVVTRRHSHRKLCNVHAAWWIYFILKTVAYKI